MGEKEHIESISKLTESHPSTSSEDKVMNILSGELVPINRDARASAGIKSY
jgi:hypothetical protein